MNLSTNVPPIRLGISSCLLGHEVRYDGDHKWDRYLVEVLGKTVQWVPVCPEVEIGLGVPRPPIQLEGDAASPLLIMPSTGEDLTEKMESYARLKVRELQALDIDGFVFKQGSPSCGIAQVKVFVNGNQSTETTAGAFARILIQMWSDLPIEEEGRLNDLGLRQRFMEKIHNYRQRREVD